MRRIRVLYVEDDLALMSLVSQQLQTDERLELVHATNSSESCLEFANGGLFDVALLDLALGNGNSSGLELAIALRSIDPHCGIVIFSQHAKAGLEERLPDDQRFSFSVLEKRAPIDFELLVSSLVRTAEGFSSTDPSLLMSAKAESPLASLSPRDLEILRMLSDGLNTDSIAKALGLAAVTVRQEISSLYTILVPTKQPGTNLRTLAIRRYLEEVRTF
jgi:DNA-binding NarL/FixJ family response regulator